RGGVSCLDLDAHGDNEVLDSSFLECTAVGVDVVLDPNASLAFVGNTVTSTLGAGVGVALAGVSGSIIDENVVSGFDTLFALTQTSDVELRLGDVCGGGAVGVVVEDSARTSVS